MKYYAAVIPVDDVNKHLTSSLINVLSNSKTPIKKLPDSIYCNFDTKIHKLNQDLVTKHKFQLIGRNETIFSWLRSSSADYSWYKRNDFFGHNFFDLFRMKDYEHLSEFHANQAQA